MSIMLDELKTAPKLYENCLKNLRADVDKIAAEVKKRGISSVVTAARGTSNNAAVFFKHINEMLGGMPVSQAAPYISTFYKTKQDLKKTLYIVVSQSGMSPDTLAMLQTAKSNGALVVAVTNNAQSPAAKEADFHLDIAAGEEKAVAATKTFTGEIIALFMLAEALNQKTVLTEAVVEKTEKAMANFKAEKCVILENSPSAIILSRGLTETIAKECALKLMECTYKFTFASSTNEFKHGPQALVAKDTPVLLFAPNGDMTDDFVKAAKTLKEKGAYIIAFSDIKALEAVADVYIGMCEVDAYEAPFVYAPVMQMFVESVTVSMGLSPDNPRNLNKVTITN